MRTDTPQTIFLKDYKEPDYKVMDVDMRFEIFDDKTIVHTKAQYTQNNDTDAPLFLNGEKLKLVSCKLDAKDIQPKVDDKGMTIPCPGKDIFTLEIVTEIYPAKNTALEGLYKSNGTHCTQCEAEGFRKVTYYQDRPDVMATFKVTVEADKDSSPVLLSNGNLVDEGDLSGGRHYTVWEDPTPKPCYLFALVAGDLVHIKDQFTTMSGQDVDLYIYVREGDEEQCDHAMQSLIKSMKWDEEVYGREYQYDRFNIVAVSDFNMGAMENTALNIFNTALVLAHQETATDQDYIRVESVIGHEYFHNWTGNRVTCRDWFQLSLKEGLTVFRDQEFSSDLNSRAVQRIDDVGHLRRSQFPEDASPLAHPVRPDNYIEINNFYTMTIYEKGAEVIRMFHTLLGPDNYRRATDLYFDRHDGQAVTCDDWFNCMQECTDTDLTQFKLWYSQAGTPEVSATGKYDESKKTYTLKLSQNIPDTAGQKDKAPMHIPVAFSLIGADGDELPLSNKKESTQVLDLTKKSQSFKFENIEQEPVPSILRNFSAPVKLQTDLTDEQLRFLMINDGDGFNKWEAGQKLYLREINALIDGEITEPSHGLLESIEHLLNQALEEGADKALLARALTMPDISIIGQSRDVVDPDAIADARKLMSKVIATKYMSSLEKIYQANLECEVFSVTPEAMAQRALKATVLLYIKSGDEAHGVHLAKNLYDNARNMTDRVTALSVLSDTKSDEAREAFADYYERFKDYQLVIDKWFSLQSATHYDGIIDDLKALSQHADFDMTNPNRVRSLYAAFAMNNPVAFHAKDGSGYEFLKAAIIELNTLNPQIAARMVTPMREWKRYTPDRQKMIKAALQEILDQPNLSANVFELVSKSLAG